MRPVKLKLIGIISVFAIILITTIGYSALNTNLTITPIYEEVKYYTVTFSNSLEEYIVKEND